MEDRKPQGLLPNGDVIYSTTALIESRRIIGVVMISSFYINIRNDNLAINSPGGFVRIKNEDTLYNGNGEFQIISRVLFTMGATYKITISQPRRGEFPKDVSISFLSLKQSSKDGWYIPSDFNGCRLDLEIFRNGEDCFQLKSYRISESL